LEAGVAVAAAQVLWQRGKTMPSWVPDALKNIVVQVSTAMQVQAAVPAREDLKKQAAACAAALEASIQSIEERLNGRGDPAFLATLAEHQAKAEQLRDRMSGGGRDDAAARIGFPSPKRVTAAGAVALHCKVCGRPPNPNNRRVQGLCQAIFELARQHVSELDSLCPSGRQAVRRRGGVKPSLEGSPKYLRMARDEDGSVPAGVAATMIDAALIRAQMGGEAYDKALMALGFGGYTITRENS
jgi:hypothetical protein